MRFHRVGEYDVVTRITGPDHHFLGLKFTLNPEVGEPVVEVVAITQDVGPAATKEDSRRIVEAIERGLHRANTHLGTDYHLGGIRYCSSDRFVEGIYAEMAEKLVEHVVWAHRQAPAHTI